MPLLLLMAPVAILIYLQPNFSMLVILAVACFIMLVIAGVRGAQLSIMLFSGVGVGSVFMLLEGYRANRISSFQDPWSAGAGGYQLRQSLIAFGSGGLWGQGLGSSRQKFLFLPYGESDMIFAIIAEELGLVGAGLLVIAYAVLYSHCFRIAMRCRDMGGRMLAAGCAALLCIQTIVNMCVATGLMPHHRPNAALHQLGRDLHGGVHGGHGPDSERFAHQSLRIFSRFGPARHIMLICDGSEVCF